MEKPTIEEVISTLTEKFGDGIFGWEQDYDFNVATVDKKDWLEIFRFLYDHETFRFVISPHYVEFIFLTLQNHFV